jgi:hypothetical protein
VIEPNSRGLLSCRRVGGEMGYKSYGNVGASTTNKGHGMVGQ